MSPDTRGSSEADGRKERFLFFSRFTANVLLFRAGLHEPTHLILKIGLVASVIIPL